MVLLAINGLIAYTLLRNHPNQLVVTFLDVGQGDAILIEGPTGAQVLIDGGKDRSALRELPKHMSVLDRDIDMIVATHPDADHIGGLPEIFHRYAVTRFMSSSVASDSWYAEALSDAVQNEPGLTHVVAHRGMRLHLGGGAYADVLYPDRDIPSVDTNTGSVVLRIVYGNTSFVLSGDAPQLVEEWVTTLDVIDAASYALDADVLKAGHHGSRTSTSEAWMKALSPDVVVISAGKDNSYGHPHEEIVSRIREYGSELVSTAESGSISFVSDGYRVYRKD